MKSSYPITNDPSEALRKQNSLGAAGSSCRELRFQVIPEVGEKDTLPRADSRRGQPESMSTEWRAGEGSRKHPGPLLGAEGKLNGAGTT